MNDDKEIISLLQKDLSLDLPENILLNDAAKYLAAHINQLIQNDFHKLISILYRLDVSEAKLKQLLEENTDSDAGIIIANLVIERQLQKIKSRRQFSKRDNNIDENEKW
jgi:ribosome-associated translation inhibitor RaiA